MASGELMTLMGGPKVRAPSFEVETQTVPATKSWYSREQIASLVVLPSGIMQSIHWRSTKKGWPLEFCGFRNDWLCCGQVWPLSNDLKMSTWSVLVPLTTFKLLS